LYWSPLRKNGWDIRIKNYSFIWKSLRVVFTGAFLFMLLDVVIDPVAFQGDRWFLGKIYTYKEEGEYFNIPLTNFGGWFLVGSAILYCFTRIDSRLDKKGFLIAGIKDLPAQALLGPGVYFGVLVFNLGVTFYIGEYLMGLCGTALSLAVLASMIVRIRKGNNWEG
jgi:putative membrane protein